MEEIGARATTLKRLVGISTAIEILTGGLSRRRRAITESAEVAGIRRPYQQHRAMPKTPRPERAGAFGRT